MHTWFETHNTCSQFFKPHELWREYKESENLNDGTRAMSSLLQPGIQETKKSIDVAIDYYLLILLIKYVLMYILLISIIKIIFKCFSDWENSSY